MKVNRKHTPLSIELGYYRQLVCFGNNITSLAGKLKCRDVIKLIVRKTLGKEMLCPIHEMKRRITSASIGKCVDCIRSGVISIEEVLAIHQQLRQKQKLVPAVPNEGKYVCPECGNHCRLNEDEIGFCGQFKVQNGQVIPRYGDEAVVSWYFDPLPTNCVADWVCPVTQHDTAFPIFRRLKNLAVFYGSCNSNCLFCQNSSYKQMMVSGQPRMTAEELASFADEKTACVCFFGGDPACNAQHSLHTAELLNKERPTIVCYETNGNISSKWLDKIADVVQNTGGTLKFDLKAYSPEVYTALTGAKNDVVQRNFEKMAKRGKNREGEFLVASILLVPGFVDKYEIRQLCEFIAKCDPTIPTALLGFFPQHHMSDLPRTSRRHAEAARTIAHDCGLTNVRIGNIGLLSTEKYEIGSG